MSLETLPISLNNPLQTGCLYRFSQQIKKHILGLDLVKFDLIFVVLRHAQLYSEAFSCSGT